MGTDRYVLPAVVQRAISSGVAFKRADTLKGIPVDVVARLPVHPEPADQLRSDAQRLLELDPLGHGVFATWLANVMELVPARRRPWWRRARVDRVVMVGCLPVLVVVSFAAVYLSGPSTDEPEVTKPRIVKIRMQSSQEMEIDVGVETPAEADHFVPVAPLAAEYSSPEAPQVMDRQLDHGFPAPLGDLKPLSPAQKEALVVKGDRSGPPLALPFNYSVLKNSGIISNGWLTSTAAEFPGRNSIRVLVVASWCGPSRKTLELLRTNPKFAADVDLILLSDERPRVTAEIVTLVEKGERSLEWGEGEARSLRLLGPYVFAFDKLPGGLEYAAADFGRLDKVVDSFPTFLRCTRMGCKRDADLNSRRLHLLLGL